jgi:hypothetical protein
MLYRDGILLTDMGFNHIKLYYESHGFSTTQGLTLDDSN